MVAILRILPGRIATMALTLFLISIVIFGLTQALPGDAAFTSLGQYGTEEGMIKLRAQMGLDLPYWIQYTKWLTKFIRGDFGESLIMGIPIKPILLERLKNSAILSLLSLIGITFFGVLFGILCGIRKDSVFDQTISSLAFIGVSIPEFVSGSLLILLFSGVVWDILPSGGYVSVQEGFWPWFSRLILPSVTLTVVLLAHVMRMTRSSMIEVLRTNYIRTARLKGLDEKGVIIRHALRNALMPTVTLLAMNIGWLMGGIVVVESVFAFPGLGRLTILAIQKRDIPMIQASVLIVAVIYLSANVITDLSYMFLNPKTRPSRI
jgi:peptide/nickel transport system permease protein